MEINDLNKPDQRKLIHELREQFNSYESQFYDYDTSVYRNAQREYIIYRLSQLNQDDEKLFAGTYRP